MTAYAWDTLTPAHRQQIIDRVAEQHKTYRLEQNYAVLGIICMWAIDALGKSDPVENAYERGMDEGREAGYYEGYEAGFNAASDAIKALAEPQ